MEFKTIRRGAGVGADYFHPCQVDPLGYFYNMYYINITNPHTFIVQLRYHSWIHNSWYFTASVQKANTPHPSTLFPKYAIWGICFLARSNLFPDIQYLFRILTPIHITKEVVFMINTPNPGGRMLDICDAGI